MGRLRIAAIEPYLALSHRRFLEELAAVSRHEIELFTLPPRRWKWRMRTAGLHFAPLVAARGPWDLLLVSDYLDLPQLYALLPRGARDVPAVSYFHENQLTYPLREGEKRDHHFALCHLQTVLASERALFNSRYHLDAFYGALRDLARHAPDVDLPAAVERARERSEVLPLGTGIDAAEPRTAVGETPVIVWNHRWEYDKGPEELADALLALAARGRPFRARLLGQRFRERPEAFERLRHGLGERLEHAGFLDSRAEYLAALGDGHVVFSTARHEFFGLGTLEAIRLGLQPCLPDDLAYPELLPAELRRPPQLYPRDGSVVEALEAALDRVTCEDGSDRLGRERQRLVDSTEGFRWSRLGARYDAAFEDAAAGAPAGAGSPKSSPTGP